MYTFNCITLINTSKTTFNLFFKQFIDGHFEFQNVVEIIVGSFFVVFKIRMLIYLFLTFSFSFDICDELKKISSRWAVSRESDWPACLCRYMNCKDVCPRSLPNSLGHRLSLLLILCVLLDYVLHQCQMLSRSIKPFWRRLLKSILLCKH